MTGNFTVAPSVITSGDLGPITFTLPSLSASVTAASIRDDLGNVVIADALTGSLDTAKPGATRTYTLVAQNAAGATANATTSVTVRSVADSLNTTLLASAPSVTVGGSITLTPAFPASYTGFISGPGLSSPLVVTTGQQFPVGIPAAGTNAYTLTVQNDAAPVATFTTAATNVIGVAVPVIATFTASASTVTNGNTVTITYNVTGGDCAVAARCRITGPSFSFDILGTNDGSNHVTTPATPSSGATSTYVLALVNSTGAAAGTVSRSMAVQAVAAPTAALVASAVEVAKGSTITLTPTFSGASSYIADDAGVHVGVDNPTSGVATAPITVSRTNTYTLVVLNAAGASVTDSVTVTALNTIAQTGNTTAARFGGTATLLNNGRVLIAGGGSTAGSTGTDSAEIYNPITRTYSTTGNLGTPRRDHTAHLLADGTVLLVGGFDGAGAPLSALEAYDPGAGTFSSITITGGTSGGMVNPRALHTSTVLADGTLLVAGGCGTAACDITLPDARATAEIIDLVAGSTSATTPMNAQHVRATGTLLGSGKVLIAGGATSAGGNGTDFGEIFSAGTFSCPGTTCVAGRAAMGTARNGHGALLLPNGQVALFGGKTNTGTMTATIELFNPAATGTFTANAASIGAPRWLLQATQLAGAGRILISGGFTTGTATASMVLNLFDVSGTTLTAVTGIDSLTTARGGHTATLLFGGTALMSGGTSGAASGELFSSAQ